MILPFEEANNNPIVNGLFERRFVGYPSQICSNFNKGEFHFAWGLLE
jgi:hypothetical protein